MLRLIRTNHHQPPSKKLKGSSDYQDNRQCNRDGRFPTKTPPPDLSFTFDVSSDDEEELEELNNLLLQNEATTTAAEAVLLPPKYSLKNEDRTTTTTTETSVITPLKQVRWRQDKLVTHIIGDTDHRKMNQWNESYLNMSDFWLTRHDLAKIKEEEMSLYFHEQASSVDNDWDPIVPTAKMYLLECKGVYDWMESELFPQSPSLTDENSDIRKRKQPSRKQEDWSNEDFFRLVLHNNPALWNGWTYFRGMESGRTHWRRARNKATLYTILRLQQHKNATELAATANRMTAVDAIWARFAAVGDEQQLLMDELDALQHELNVMDSSKSRQESTLVLSLPGTVGATAVSSFQESG